jgi:hypothetical protein
VIESKEDVSYYQWFKVVVILGWMPALAGFSVFILLTIFD